MTRFYELQAPTRWASPPVSWSSTSIDDVAACPRRWQLLHSHWGEFERFPVRQHPAAIEGQIIHEALDRLARACGRRGNPPIGTPAFAEAAAAADFFGGFAKALAVWSEQLAAHPRPGPPFRLHCTNQELANRAVRLFRAQYKVGAAEGGGEGARVGNGRPDLMALLRATGVLTEVRIEHPVIPFVGVLDRVTLAPSGVEIVDFKTGKFAEKHETQLRRYAMLWWRSTHTVPARVCAQYLDGAKTWAISGADVEREEDALREGIDSLARGLGKKPAEARTSQACRWCPVRARCSDGWLVAEENARGEGSGDAELVVASEPGSHGFLARARNGAEVAVVHDASLVRLLPSLQIGRVIRLIDALRRDKGKELEIKAWTEVYVVEGDHAR